MENSESGEIQREANSSIKDENENTEIQEESRTSSGNENQNKQLANNIETMLKMLEVSAPKNECRIYKVPYHLRKRNEEAYTPQVISIGPYHHNKEKFETMEKHKVRYFKHFMKRTEKNLEELVSSIREMEDCIRCCYVATVQLKDDDFVQMIMFDAAFILELFLKYRLGGWTADDPMFVEAWLYGMVRVELLLLENQLPFFVIAKLYHLALPHRSNAFPLIDLTFHFFRFLNIQNKPPEEEINHFTDLLRLFQLPPHEKLAVRDPKMVYPTYSASQLREAGVKFKVASSKCVLDLNFKGGVLEIPLLHFQDVTEAYVRNIMALEQCYHSKDRYITDFYIILDHLIDTTKDVDLLTEKGIIVNRLGDSNAVAFMINNLNKGIFTSNMNSDFCRLCEELNAFYEKPWHRWKALLRHQYFSTPWRWTSTIAAVILLVLTLIQTISSIIQIVPIVKSW